MAIKHSINKTTLYGCLYYTSVVIYECVNTTYAPLFLCDTYLQQ